MIQALAVAVRQAMNTRTDLPVSDTAPVPAGIAPALLIRAGRWLRAGRLVLSLPDGRTLCLSSGAVGPDARLEIHSWRAALRLLLGGATGLADGYAAGEWDTPDLARLLWLGAFNLDRPRPPRGLSFLAEPWRVLRHRANANTRAGSRRNISLHYDLGNDFYAVWLDPGMTYSGALFGPGARTLEAAQERKYRRLLDGLASRPGQHLLEIGCGWGGLAEMAARDYGLRVTAITLSRRQCEYARARIEAAGLSDRVSVRLMDYRDVGGRFDHVVSVEMMEAVGEKYWPSYFDRVADLVRPGGRVALQVITISPEWFARYRRRPDFIQSRVFPGGMLPTRDHVTGLAAAQRLTPVRAPLAFGGDYARTLAHWRRRFEAAAGDVAALGHDVRFRRMWRFYLAYCEAGFRAGRIGVHQFLFENATLRGARTP